MTPPLNWQTVTARIPTECDGFYCRHSTIPAGATIHFLASESDPENATRLCDECYRRGNQPPPRESTS